MKNWIANLDVHSQDKDKANTTSIYEQDIRRIMDTEEGSDPMDQKKKKSGVVEILIV